MNDDEFRAFMADAQPGLLRFGHVLTGSRHEAEELVQQALVKTYVRWDRLTAEQPVAYVRRVMVTTYTSWWRVRRREAPMPDGYDIPAAATQEFSDRDAVMRFLLTLPARQRAVVVLRYYCDQSETEIASTLGCSVGTVKSQASRALNTLRGRLQQSSATTRQGTT